MTSHDPEKDELTVRLPDELPVLTPSVSRILLDILVELTEVEPLDGPTDKEPHDC